jgi:hypothetical protein
MCNPGSCVMIIYLMSMVTPGSLKSMCILTLHTCVFSISMWSFLYLDVVFMVHGLQ